MEIMVLKERVDSDFWKSKRVFLTGHTGFKGSWMSLWLQSMGSIVKGYSLTPPTNPSLFVEGRVSANMESEIGDIRDLNSLKNSITKFNPDIVIHMAAQPLVRLSYSEPIETITSNVIGTANILEASRLCNNLKAIVSVTSDKCYDNKEFFWSYRENDALGGHDPYSSSKGCAELITSSYRRSFYSTDNSASIATARAGNVIGGGDWAKDRLIPDAVNAFESGRKIIIRNPKATRPWQHVLEPISGYLMLAQALYINGDVFAEAWNFGPKDSDCKTVEWILNEFSALWQPQGKLDMEAYTENTLHEAHFLKLDCSKTTSLLKWQPKWNIKEALKLTYDWFENRRLGNDIQNYSLNQINLYQSEITSV